MSSNSQSQNIQVTIELGHQASFKKKPSPEGYTHDWSVFVRGPEGSKIQHYVEKVVFQLHESFAKPKRVVKEPPYQVSESGYAGFNFPIIIYFRNKEIPKKISFDYDLCLNAENCPPINNVRYEKLTFKNPNEEFRQKLLKAGGQPMGNPALMETAGTPSSSSSKSDSGKKLPKSSTSTTSSKDGSSSNSKDKTPKHKSSLVSSNSGGGSSSKPSTPQSTPVASKEIKSVTHTTTISVSKDHKSRGKEAQKRPSTSSPPDGEMSGKKIKRSSSISSDLGKEKHSHKSDKDKKKSSKDSSKSKSKHSSKSDKHEKKKDKHKHSSSSSDKKNKNTSSSETKTSSNSQSSKKSSDSIPFPSDIPMKTALLSPLKDSSDDDEDDKTVKKDSDSVSSLSSDLSSSSSSISLSPLPEAERKKSSKYDALMAELGDSDSSDDDFNVKIPVIPPSPPPPLLPPSLPKSTPETKPVTVIESKQTKKSKSSSSQSKKSSSKSEKSKSKESKKKDSSKSTKESKTSNNKESPEVIQNGVAKEDNKSEVVAENGETLASLWELHDRIMASRDSDMLEEVVGLIEETGLFKVTDTSFDFDLCSIDKETVQKIFKCVSSVS